MKSSEPLTHVDWADRPSQSTYRKTGAFAGLVSPAYEAHSHPSDVGELVSNKLPEIVIVAGEASGDLHGARLVQALQLNYPDLYQISAIGGQHLAALPVKMLHPLAQYGVTGITEVLTHLQLIRQAFKLITRYLKNTRPALLILIDYPGFNLRLAKYAKTKLGLKVLYYISPQIWAWKANRIHAIKKYVDHMAVILPFEKSIYEKAQVPCTFVGHPLLEDLLNSDLQSARKTLDLPSKSTMVALLPGSRRNELKYHLPVLVGTAKRLLQRFPDLQFFIPIASSLSKEKVAAMIQDNTLPITLTTAPAQLVMSASDMVVVASGTASLECALLTKPMCIIYKTSLLTSIIASRVIKVKYIGLCNLIANRMIVPELLQNDCTEETISTLVADYLTTPTLKQQMIHQLEQVKNTLTCSTADTSLEKIVYQLTQP
jgi:lipid-A-disaccharide synthase